MVAVAPSSTAIPMGAASCAAPSGTLESGASVFVGGESGSDDFLLDGVDDSRRNKPMRTRDASRAPVFLGPVTPDSGEEKRDSNVSPMSIKTQPAHQQVHTHAHHTGSNQIQQHHTNHNHGF